MTTWLRVKHLDTGHEFTVSSRAFDPARHVRTTKPAVGQDGRPLRPKPARWGRIKRKNSSEEDS